MTEFGHRFDLSRVFDRLTIGTVAGLTLIMLLLLLVLVLYSRLHMATEDNNYELLVEVEALQETAHELQDALENINQIPNEDLALSSELDGIEERLEQIDETLEIIEENIIEIAPVAETVVDADSVPPSTQEIEDIQKGIGQLFAIVAYLIGGMSIITAVVLIFSVITRPRRRRNEL